MPLYGTVHIKAVSGVSGKFPLRIRRIGLHKNGDIYLSMEDLFEHDPAE